MANNMNTVNLQAKQYQSAQSSPEKQDSGL